MCVILFIFLFTSVCAAGDADVSNYFVVEMPTDSKTLNRKEFKVYWNVPTAQCRSKRVPFEDLFEKFGIVQNQNDTFQGEQVTILYDPGVFPAILNHESNGEVVYRNGGVPQEGNLERHLKKFKLDLDAKVPDANFSGIGIIDFESWRPIFRQNFGELSLYKETSYDIERRRHWWWPRSEIVAEATKRFEEAAIQYMESTLRMARDMRPLGTWAYYAYPYCFNMAGNHMLAKCADHVHEENDRLSWLWSLSNGLYPSIYSSKSLTTDQLVKMIRGRVVEADRLSKSRVPILPYFWFRYRDGSYMSEKDLKAALYTLYNLNASGLIIWGSSRDVNTTDKCLDLLQYVNEILGPAVSKYTRNVNRFDDLVDNNESSLNSSISGQLDGNKTMPIVTPLNDVLSDGMEDLTENDNISLSTIGDDKELIANPSSDVIEINDKDISVVNLLISFFAGKENDSLLASASENTDNSHESKPESMTNSTNKTKFIFDIKGDESNDSLQVLEEGEINKNTTVDRKSNGTEENKIRINQAITSDSSNCETNIPSKPPNVEIEQKESFLVLGKLNISDQEPIKIRHSKNRQIDIQQNERRFSKSNIEENALTGIDEISILDKSNATKELHDSKESTHQENDESHSVNLLDRKINNSDAESSDMIGKKLDELEALIGIYGHKFNDATNGVERNHSRFFICIMYFYSIQQCLCHIYEQCV